MKDRENILHSFCSASAVKRSIDVAVAALGILILSPIQVAVGAAILLVMGRPCFFDRYGQATGQRPSRCTSSAP